jgi:glycosyltransferase involved in cell wall biosynthesis
MLPFFLDRRRIQHLSCADLITTVTPQCELLIKRLVSKFGPNSILSRIKYIPHPQLDIYTYDGSVKENLILTVGRWHKNDWDQKNPKLLIKAAAIFLRNRKDYEYVIIGSYCNQLLPIIQKYAADVAHRIHLHDFMRPEELLQWYQRSKIGFWSSRSEGQQGAGAQALCCGCSLVATTGISMNCFSYYSSRGSGLQTVKNCPVFLADALAIESQNWDNGHRVPQLISDSWCNEFNYINVCNHVISEINLQKAHTSKCE